MYTVAFRRAYLVLAFFVVFFLSSISAGYSASISGTVRDSVGDALSGQAYNVNVNVYSGSACNPQYVTGTYIDDAGAYSISGLAPGTYYVEATNWGLEYLNAWYTASGELSSYECAGALPIELATDADVSGKDFMLPIGAEISGIVSDVDGPLTGKSGGVTVTVYDTNNPCDSWLWGEYSATIDETGAYTISGLPPASYYIQATPNQENYIAEWHGAAGSTRECSEAAPLTAVVNGVDGNIDFTLDAGAVISGTVRMADGSAFVGLSGEVVVDVYTGDPCNYREHVTSAYIDESGVYSILGLTPGTYFLQAATYGLNYLNEWYADSASSVECYNAIGLMVGEGSVLQNKDFQLDDGATISGIVKDSVGDALSGQAYNVYVYVYSGSACNPQYVTETYIDDAGAYSISGLAPGTYYVEATNWGLEYLNAWYTASGELSSYECSGALPIELATGADVSGKDFMLPVGAEISGIVSDVDGPLTGKSGGVTVTVYDTNNPCDSWLWGEYSATIDETGAYTISGLPPASYYIQATPNQENYIAEWHGAAGSTRECSEAAPLTAVVNGVDGNIDFTLDAGAVISGTVRMADGSAFVGLSGEVVVDVYTGDPCNYREHVTSAYIDESGVYSILGLTPGTYFLQAATYGLNYLNEWYADSASSVECYNAIGLTVGEGSVLQDKDFQLDDGATISGIVKDSAGDALSGQAYNVYVYVYSGSACNPQYVTETYIDDAGAYSISGLAPGTYYVEATNWGLEYLNAWYTASGELSSYECSGALPIELATGADVSGKDFMLPVGAEISGIVSDVDGPLTGKSGGVTVTVYDTTTNNPCESMLWGEYSATIDETGAYTISGLPPASYYIQATPNQENYIAEWYGAAGSTQECSEAAPLTVVVNGVDENIDFTLDVGAEINGTIKNSSNTPITGEFGNIQVDLYNGDPCNFYYSWVAQGYITEDGSYSISSLSPGTYYARTSNWGVDYIDEWYAVSASTTDSCEATAIVISAEEIKLDIDFQLDSAARITGTVRDSNGDPIINHEWDISINLFTTDPCSSSIVEGVAWAEIDSNGAYSITGLTPGVYYAQATTWNLNYLNEWYGETESSTECSEAFEISVGSEQTVADINFNLDTGAVIKGTVRDENDMIINGTVGEIMIRAHRDTDCGREVAGSGSIDENGAYSIIGLSPGMYYVEAEPSSLANYLNEWYDSPVSSTDSGNAEPVTLLSEEIKEYIDFQLNAGGSVSGTLFNLADAPITGYDWQLEVNIYRGECSSSLEYVASGTVAIDGTYSLSGLGSGDYYAEVVSYLGTTDYLDGWYTGSASSFDCSEALAFTVAEALETSDINFKLSAGATITGTVRDSDGVAVSDTDYNLQLSLMGGEPCGDNWWVHGSGIDENGTYSIDHIGPGTYFLQTRTNSGELNFQDEWYSSSGSTADCNLAESLTIITAEETIDSIDFQLAPGAQISGVVKGSNGEDILNFSGDGFNNGSVEIFSGDPCGNDFHWVKSGYTDVNDEYVISGLAPGTYYVSALVWNGTHISEWYGDTSSSAYCEDADPVTIDIDTPATGIDFQLDLGGSLSGSVSGILSGSDTCNPGVQFSIDIFKGSPCGDHEFVDSGWYWSNQDTSSYYLGQLPAGTYYVQVSSGSFISEWYTGTESSFQCENAEIVTVESGVATENIDFQLISGGRIYGSILDDQSNPINGEYFGIALWDIPPCEAQNGPVSYTSNNGYSDYLSSPLPPGDYYVSIETSGTSYVQEYWASAGSNPDCAEAEIVTLTVDVDSGPINFHISQGATISGTVYQEDGITPIIGENIDIDIWNVAPCDGSTGPVSWAQVDPGTGDFSSEGLPPGEYYLSVFTGGTVYYSEYWANGGSERQCDQADPITLGQGEQVTGKDFALGMGGSIAGTIYETDGSTELVGDRICVDVFRGTPCDGNTWEYLDSGCNDVEDMQGNYQSGGLEPGEYFLWTNTENSGYIREFGGGSTSDINCENAVTVTVTTGTTVVGQDFQLAQGGSVSGTVFNSDGELISGETSDVTVQIFAGADGCSAGFLAEISNIDLDGNYFGTGFPLGNYYLMTYDHAGLYQNEWYAAGESSPDCSNAETFTITGTNEVNNLDFQLNGDACPNDPEKSAPGQCGCGNLDTDTDLDGTADCNDECIEDIDKILAGECGCGIADTDSDNDGTADCNEICDDDPLKTDPGVCGCDNADTDTDGDGTADCNDECINDSDKIFAGQCGCGTADTDTDLDGTADCNDTCSDDPNKVEEGQCGCGIADIDSDGDGTLDCNEMCDDDPLKTDPGVCGCGTADTDTDNDGTADCNEICDYDPLKTDPGVCGCDNADTDTDGDGTLDCNEICDDDPLKTDPGVCGCGTADTDTDGDGTADCNDICVDDPDKTEVGQCGCGNADTDTDGDETADCNDICSDDPHKVEEGQCGCGNADTDSDGDGVADCNDACDDDPYKFEEGICGCGLGDSLDLDGDTVADCEDNCPGIPNADQADSNSNGIGDACELDDDDGIAPDIDGEWKNGIFTNQDGNYSNNFSDSEIATTKIVTYGTIEARNSLIFIIADAAEENDGVSVNVTTADVNSTSEAEMTICTYSLLLSRGDSFVATCSIELVVKEGLKDALVKSSGDDSFVIKALYGNVRVKLGTEEFIEIPLDGEVTIQETSNGTFEIENTSEIPVVVVTPEGEQILEPQETMSVDAAEFPWAMFLPAFTGNAANQ